jgi:AmiR/NasT family two-component response regulator
MSAQPKKLLCLIEFISHSKLPHFYKSLGFDVTTEWQARKAVSLVRKLKPDVIVADFYFQADFRDRLSNVESLLAAAQPMKDTGILLLYEAQNQPVLEKVRERMRVDAVLTVPVQEDALRTILSSWRDADVAQ